MSEEKKYFTMDGGTWADYLWEPAPKPLTPNYLILVDTNGKAEIVSYNHDQKES